MKRDEKIIRYVNLLIIVATHESNEIMKLPVRFLVLLNLKTVISSYVLYRKCYVSNPFC